MNSNINFISVCGKKTAYDRAKSEHPSSIIFYQGAGNWIIYADGQEFEFGNSAKFKEVREQLKNLQITVDDLKKNSLFRQDIDTSVTNGARLIFNDENKLQIELDLSSTENNGAMSAQDKSKLDTFDWINF